MRFFEFPLHVPTYNSSTDSWSNTTFDTLEVFTEYVESCFKIPGEYNLRNTDKWKEAANTYVKSCTRPNLEGGKYSSAIKGTSSYFKFWNNEKDKCKKGVIYDDIYLPPFYYFYLNYCPFQDDVRGKKGFALIHDNDVYFAHYLMLCILKGKHCGVLKARQRGYEQPYSSPVLTPKGFVQMGELNVGDLVITHTNSHAKILEIFEQGEKDVYNVHFMDGRIVRCGLEHLWTVYDKHAKKDKVLSLRTLIETGISNPINKGKNVAYRFAVPDIEPIEFPKQSLTIDPYLLGCLLGDGTIKNQLKIASVDQELIKELKTLGLWGCNVDNKFIPEIYKKSSIEQRLEIVRGLMDTDGYISNEGCMEFKNCAPQLIKDLVDILRSLGIKVTYKKFPPKKENDREYYRVYIKTNKFNLFHLSRKSKLFNPNKNIYKRVPIVKIEKLNYRENSRCIMIDSPEKIYLTEDYIPTHNSLKITAVLYWSYTWFEGTVNTIGAIDEGKVLKSWRFIERYKSHCDKNTNGAFKRGPIRPKSLEWIERTELKDGGFIGLDSTLKGTTFQKSFDAGVGGAQTFFFYEEAGIAPTMLKTIGYIRPTVEKGTMSTGTIICSGALGELEDAEDLKEIFYNPNGHNFLSVTNVWDKDPMRANAPCCLFISEAYNMEGTWNGKPFYDKDGNTDLEHSMAFIEHKKEELKTSGKSSELIQLDLSQKITSPEEGFSQRKEGFFPTRILKPHKDRLLISKPSITRCELYEDKDGLIKFYHVDREPITEFPYKGMKDLDKRGAVCIAELPKVEKGESEPPPRMYFAGVDPIQTDITTTSESLFCIYIFKNITRVKYKDPDTGELKIKNEGYKPVAWYIGRYDDRKQTNEQAELLIRMYNAYALVENNVTSFIDHMRAKNLDHKYLMPSSEAKRIWGEDVVVETESHRAYGIYMSPTGKLKSFLLNKEKDYVSDVLDVMRTTEGKIVRTIYGCEKISDEGLLNEMIGYEKRFNIDRLVAFGLALAACEMYINSGLTSDFDDSDSEQQDLVHIKSPKRFFSNRINFKN